MNSSFALNEPNIGYAGFLFKKSTQPNSLRTQNIKPPIDFIESNIFVYINRKIKEFKQNSKQNSIPKDFYKDHSISLSLKKNFLKNHFLNTIQKNENSYINSIFKKTDKTKNNIFIKHKFVKKISGLNNPEKKVRNVLYEKISDKNFEKCFNEFKREALLRDFEKMIMSDPSILEDSVKKTIAFKDLILNYQNFDKKEKFIEILCQNNNITLSNLLDIDEEKIQELLSASSFFTSNRKNTNEKNFQKTKIAKELNSDEETEKKIESEKKQQTKSEKFLRKANNYLLKSKITIKTIQKLSAPKSCSHTYDLSNTIISSNPHQIIYSPQKNSITSKQTSKTYNEFAKKFKDFYQKCDNEDHEAQIQTNNLKGKMNILQKHVLNLVKTTNNKNSPEKTEEGPEGNFQHFKNTTKFKKKIIDVLLNPIKKKQDLYFMYSKNQMIKDHINTYLLTRDVTK